MNFMRILLSLSHAAIAIASRGRAERNLSRRLRPLSFKPKHPGTQSHIALVEFNLQTRLQENLFEAATLTHFIRIHSRLFLRLLAFTAAVALCSCHALAQQTLGGITGEVTDASGGVIPNVTVTVVDEQTSLTRTTTTNGSGTYQFVNLPIGTYTITYKAEGFDVQKTQHITVQANRTATVNAALKVGQTTTTVEVEATPLMNAVDTTNGYVLDTSQIDAVPLCHRQLHRCGDSFTRRQCRTFRRNRLQQRPRQRPHLGQRPARHQSTASL